MGVIQFNLAHLASMIPIFLLYSSGGHQFIRLQLHYSISRCLVRLLHLRLWCLFLRWQDIRPLFRSGSCLHIRSFHFLAFASIRCVETGNNIKKSNHIDFSSPTRNAEWGGFSIFSIFAKYWQLHVNRFFVILSIFRVGWSMTVNR